MLKAFPFVYKFFYHIHGCAVVGLYCFEAIRPEYHEVSNLIQVFLFTYPFPLANYKNCMYSGCTSTAAARRLGSSTNRRLTCAPWIFCKFPSYPSNFPLANYKNCMYSGCTSTAAARRLGSSTNRRLTCAPWIFCKFPSYPSNGPPTMRTFLPIMSEDISSGV